MKKSDNKIKLARNTRRLRFGTASTVLTAVVIAAVVLLNVLVGIVADKFPVTWDLSKDKIFTLTEESVAVAEKMVNDVKIVLFMAEEQFENPVLGSAYGIPELDTNLKEIRTAVQQYATHSKGKVTFEYIDPDQEPQKLTPYSEHDVQTGDILFISGEGKDARYRKTSIAEMSNFADVISSVQYGYGYTFESKVEKVLGSNIYALQSENDRVIQVLVGHGEDSDTITGLKSLYELNGFTFEEMSITGSAEFNKDAEVMLIAAPSTDYSNDEIKRVQQWVYNDGNYGRHLLVFTNPTVDCPNLYELLDVEYGIQVTDELLLETDWNRVYGYTQSYPMCDVPATDYTPHSAGTAVVCTPIARRLTTTLASAPESEDTSIYTIGVPLTNYPNSTKLIKLEKLDSDNAEDEIFSADAYPVTSMIACVMNSYNNNTYEPTYGSVIVSGSPAMAYSALSGNSAFNNEELLLDAINTVTGTEDGVTISNKTITTDTVTFSPNTQIWLGLVVFTIALPLALLIVSLVVFLRRKNL